MWSLISVSFAGDIGYYDNEENIFVVGRFKELIKYKGFQVRCHILTWR